MIVSHHHQPIFLSSFDSTSFTVLYQSTTSSSLVLNYFSLLTHIKYNALRYQVHYGHRRFGRQRQRPVDRQLPCTLMISGLIDVR